MSLKGKNILITGSARRLGHFFAITAAREGAGVILHYGQSRNEALSTAQEIENLGSKCWIINADLEKPSKAADKIKKILDKISIYALVNNASIFEAVKFLDTSLIQWQRHLDINLTSPFIISPELIMNPKGEALS